MAPFAKSGIPGCNWHIWELGLTLGQELLAQSKNIAGKLGGTVPGAAEERAHPVDSSIQATGSWARSRLLAFSPRVFCLRFQNKLGECFCSWEERWGNPSEAFLCFTTFYVLKAATKISPASSSLLCFPLIWLPENCCYVCSCGLEAWPQHLIQSVNFGVKSIRSVCS